MYLEFKTIQIICCLIAIIMVLSCCNYVAKEKEYRGDLEMNKQQNIEKETTERDNEKRNSNGSYRKIRDTNRAAYARVG